MKKVLLFLFSVLLVSASENTVFVQSMKAEILEAPAFGSAPVFTAVKGDQLDLLGSRGRWINVGGAEGAGWVSALLVGPEPPVEKVTVFTGAEMDIGKESRRRASALTSSAAARGLTEEERKRLGHQGDVDFAALAKIEAYKVTDGEVSEFMKERGD